MAAMLMKQPLMRQKDVAKVLGVTQANVSKLLGRHQNLVEVDAGYRNKWVKVNG
jgi:predicted transcriptional regulator